MLWPLPHRHVLHTLPAFPGSSCGISVPALCRLLLNLSPSAKTKPPEQPASPQYSSAAAGENLRGKKWACLEKPRTALRARLEQLREHTQVTQSRAVLGRTPLPPSQKHLSWDPADRVIPPTLWPHLAWGPREWLTSPRDSPKMSLWSLRVTRDLRQAPHQAPGPADLGILIHFNVFPRF